MATIKEVAARAGVSSATVSRVLSGRTPVEDRKREQVLQAVAELNYRPNLLASNLRRQRSAKIGVVVPDIENPHFSQSIRIFEEIAYREGFRVLLCNTEDQPDKQQAYLEVLADERVEGILLVPYNSEGPEISTVIDRGIPILGYDRPVDDPRADAVIADNYEGAYRATQLLVEAGHERIGFIGGIVALKPGADRQAGYEAALRLRDLRPYIFPGEFNRDRAREATSALLSHPDRMTAMVIGSNLMSIGAQRALREHNIRVPDDLAVVGIDDPWWSELMQPPMTTVAQPVRRMAEAAVNLLFERIAGTRTQPRCVIYGYDIRIRQSCGTNGRS